MNVAIINASKVISATLF